MKSVKKVSGRPSQVGSLVFSLSTLTIALCALVLCLSGCRYVDKLGYGVGKAVTDLAMLGEGEEFAQPGETEAEGRRRHDRFLRLSDQMMWSDLDRALMLDRPSRLTDRRLPR